jgi:Tfp pilus assembly protein PilX
MSRLNRKSAAPEKEGFALVITLIMVVLAAVITIALLANATTDRSIAASLTDRYQAELAAQCGLEAAKDALQANATIGGAPTPRTQNDDFIVVSAADANAVPYYFVGSCNDATNSGTSNYASPGIQYFPLFSGGTTQPGLTVTAGAAPTPNPAPASGTRAQQTFGSNTVNYPLLFSTAPYSTWQKNLDTNWQTVAAAGSNKQYRYTYWIEDLAGYVDARVAGNTDGSGMTNLRSLGYDPKEEGLFTLFSPASQADPGTTYATTYLIPDHPVLATRLSTRLGSPSSNDDTVCQTSLSANLQPDSEQSIIPHGMGYKNEGQIKTNLNTIIAKSANDTGVTTITKAISDNLPTFASARQGGLDSSQGYAETIAANIIDYADTDSTPLVGTNGTSGKSYRGIDLMAFVVEVYDMYYWDKDYYQTNPPLGDYYVDVRVRTYVSLWNIFGKDITSGVLVFKDNLAAGIQFGSPGGMSSFDAVTPVDSSPTLDFSQASPGTLKSNEYKTLLVSERVYTFDTGSPTIPSTKTFTSV